VPQQSIRHMNRARELLESFGTRESKPNSDRASAQASSMLSSSDSGSNR
jgi:hypothetical protein